MNNNDYLPNLYSMLLSEPKTRFIPCGCPIITDFLNGGIPTGQLFEIYGESGTGKTQLSLQLMFESIYTDKLNGKAVYLSTQKPLNYQKLEEMLNYFIKNKGIKENIDVLSALIFCKAATIPEYNGFIEEIKRLLAIGEKIQLIVIDNIAALCQDFHQSGSISELSERSLFLRQTATVLKGLAFNHNLAVIVINNVVAQFSDDFTKKSKVVPCLGPLWTSLINERIKLERSTRVAEEISTKLERKLKIKNSSRLQKKSLPFVIINSGLKA